MTWDDILLERHPEEPALQRALSRVFNVETRQVGLVRSSAESTGAASVRAVISRVRGDFKCLLEISVEDHLAGVDRIAGVSRLCADLAIRAFITGNTANPYQGVLVSEVGQPQAAGLDPDAEQRGEYRLWKGGE